MQFTVNLLCLQQQQQQLILIIFNNGDYENDSTFDDKDIDHIVFL